jgi:hypothetical protein
MSDEVIVTITEVAEEAIIQLTEVSENVVVTIQEALNGEIGLTGPPGASGGSSSAWNYNAKTNATSGYPGNGYLLWNNATQTSATSILVSHLTDDNTDIELLLSFFVVNQKIFIQDRDDSSKNQVWLISGTPTVTGANTSTAYYTFPVTLVSSAGGAFTNNHSLLFGQISVATNAVTSATTSDGTAELLVANLSFLNGEFITTLSSNQTDDRTVLMPDEDGTLVVGGGTASGTNTGDQTSIVGITGTTAQFNTALTDGDFATLAGSETLTNKTLTSPAINSATIGTAATFNATTYTFGAGAAAAMNQSLGTSSVDSRISSLFSAGFQFAQDNFLGRWLTASGNNAFNWLGVGSASLWSDAFWQAVGFPGGTNLATNNNAFFYYMSAVAAANIANFNEVVFDHVFSPNTLITLENIFVGIRNTASATAEVGRRGLYYEAGVDTNWQLLHETSAGVKTKVDTGKLVVINQIVRVTIKFVSATQTDMIIATSTNTTPVTVSATSGFSCTGSVGLGFWLRSTTAANRFMLQMRSTLAWPTSTL